MPPRFFYFVINFVELGKQQYYRCYLSAFRECMNLKVTPWKGGSFHA